jgi:6-phosphogluconolactonase
MKNWMHGVVCGLAALGAGACGSAEGGSAVDNAGVTHAALEDGAENQPDDSRARFAGHVYAMTNGDVENAVVHYGRRNDGRLVLVSTNPMGGRGSGAVSIPDLIPLPPPPDPLFSQGALKLTADHRFLLGVNSVDHTVTVFAVRDDGELVRTAIQDTGNIFPNALAVHDELVYVENTGNQEQGIPATINGFHLTRAGQLVPIPGSSRQLSNPAISFPVQSLFVHDGRLLFVQDVFANEIGVFPVLADGTLDTPTFNPSQGINPFGMSVVHDDILVVAEADGNKVGKTSASSYRIEGTHLVPISSSVPDFQSAGCWLTTTPNGKFAFVSNTGGVGSLSTYGVSPHGDLTLLVSAGAERDPNPEIGTTAPLDALVSADGKYLYEQFTAIGTIGAYGIGKDGTLKPIPDGDGMGLPPVGSQGLDGF